MDSVGSAVVDQDLQTLPNLDLSSSPDPEDDGSYLDDADISIWVKRKILNFLTSPGSNYESRLCWLLSIRRSYVGLQYFRIRVAENSRLTCLILLLVSRDLLLRLQL